MFMTIFHIVRKPFLENVIRKWCLTKPKTFRVSWDWLQKLSTMCNKIAHIVTERFALCTMQRSPIHIYLGLLRIKVCFFAISSKATMKLKYYNLDIGPIYSLFGTVLQNMHFS